MWPLMEAELHSILKELIRLNGKASRPEQAALFKQLFRLSLAQRELCGMLATQRNGSGVDDALVCPHPRDVGARVMAISAVIAGAVIAAQLGLGVYPRS